MSTEIVGGLTHHSICCAISAGKATLAELRKSVGGQRISVGMLPQVLKNMVGSGLILYSRGRYYLTPRGQQIVGARGFVGDTRPYVPPPKSYRRPGSEVASSLPSLYAGVPK